MELFVEFDLESLRVELIPRDFGIKKEFKAML